MKKTILLIAILTFVISATAQNIPSYVPTDSLIGYWGFDGDANDYSGNSNNGTVFGASLTNDRNGNANSAYEFDYQNWSWGSGGDRIFIPHNASFNCNQITVSAWAKRYSNGYGGNEQLAIVMRYQNGYSSPHGEYWGIMHRSQSTNYDVKCSVSGGGHTGQAGAMVHGISKALIQFDPEFKSTLKTEKLNTRDSRSVERKKPGRKKARRSFQFSKR